MINESPNNNKEGIKIDSHHFVIILNVFTLKLFLVAMNKQTGKTVQKKPKTPPKFNSIPKESIADMYRII